MPKERIAHVDLRSSIFFKDRRDGFALVDLFAEREEEDAQEDGHVKLPEEVDAQDGALHVSRVEFEGALV